MKLLNSADLLSRKKDLNIDRSSSQIDAGHCYFLHRLASVVDRSGRRSVVEMHLMRVTPTIDRETLLPHPSFTENGKCSHEPLSLRQTTLCALCISHCVEKITASKRMNRFVGGCALAPLPVKVTQDSRRDTGYPKKHTSLPTVSLVHSTPRLILHCNSMIAITPLLPSPLNTLLCLRKYPQPAPLRRPVKPIRKRRPHLNILRLARRNKRRPN